VQPTALFCWEIGEALGHIASLRHLALRFKARGYRCVFAVRELSYAYSLLHSEGFEVYQAPICGTFALGNQITANYAEVLMRFGFHKPETLASQVIAWYSIFKAVNPNIIISDSSPTVNLAARGVYPDGALGAKVYCISNGFGAPPEQAHWPAFPLAQKLPVERLRSSEATVLAAANGAAKLLGIAELKSIGDLYPAANTYIASLPELDHYERPAGHGQYIGAMAMTSSGAPPNWPLVPGALEGMATPTKIFAYLKSNYDGLEQVLKSLCELPIQTVAYIPGISGSNLKKWNTANLWISATPIHVAKALEECSLLVCHGGGLVQPTLIEGIPILALPMQIEQSMTAQKINQLGIGLSCAPEGIAKFKSVLKRLLFEPQFTLAAQSLAQRNAHFKSNDLQDAMFERMLGEMQK
jgi:hypothetical protein